jgi:hypothetical protein
MQHDSKKYRRVGKQAATVTPIDEAAQLAIKGGFLVLSPEIKDMNALNQAEMKGSDMLPTEFTRVVIHDAQGRVLEELSQKYRIFFREIALTGHVQRAADVAGVPLTAVQERRKRDRGFAKLFDEALSASVQRLRDEATRRAVDGVDKPLYWKGELVDHIREYSDTLLLALLKAKDPAFRDKVDLNTTSETNRPSPAQSFAELKKVLEDKQ